ncbi:transmembrane protein, putative [Medicago truncatula]|uniref:Transmembrane protein, putative n=1 Tax=Medicago truncatula TaxID=3880 RepID=G7L8X2_MEDTR|nr:transmembrane protein, putative [Medicago truncatula]
MSNLAFCSLHFPFYAFRMTATLVVSSTMVPCYAPFSKYMSRLVAWSLIPLDSNGMQIEQKIDPLKCISRNDNQEALTYFS